MYLDLQTEECADLPEILVPMLSELGDICLQVENLPSDRIEATLLITDDPSIQKLNREFRAIDQPTDVLSFPSVSYPHGKTAGNAGGLLKVNYIPEHKSWFIGDLAISIDRTKAQAYAPAWHSVKMKL